MKRFTPIFWLPVVLCGLNLCQAEEGEQPAPEGKAPWNRPLEGLGIQHGAARVAPEVEICKKAPAPQTEAIPAEHAEDKVIALMIEGLTRTENGFYQVKLCIINPTEKAINFTGYSEVSPITKTQHWVEGKWVEQKRFLRCGTGLRPCFIEPGQSAVFQATLEGDKLPARIGLDYRVGPAKTPTTLWSEKIDR